MDIEKKAQDLIRKHYVVNHYLLIDDFNQVVNAKTDGAKLAIQHALVSVKEKKEAVNGKRI